MPIKIRYYLGCSGQLKNNLSKNPLPCNRKNAGIFHWWVPISKINLPKSLQAPPGRFHRRNDSLK
jgi:hypothetical protein